MADLPAVVGEVDAFRPDLGLSRRDALWAIKPLRDIACRCSPPLTPARARSGPRWSKRLSSYARWRRAARWWRTTAHTGLTRRHPLAFLRDGLAAKGVMICASAPNVRDIFIPDLRLGSGIKVPARDFR